MSGKTQRTLPFLVIRFTLRTLLLLMLLVCVFFAGRASIVPKLEAEQRATRAAIERYQQLEQEMESKLLWEQLHPFEAAERDNLRRWQERINRGVRGQD